MYKPTGRPPGRPRLNKPMRVLTAQVPEKVHKKMLQYSIEQNTTLSKAICGVLEQFLEWEGVGNDYTGR